MAGNDRITIVTSRKLHILPFIAEENRLSACRAWKELIEELERQFRFFRINLPSDKEDALLIYGGRELVRLGKFYQIGMNRLMNMRQ